VVVVVVVVGPSPPGHLGTMPSGQAPLVSGQTLERRIEIGWKIVHVEIIPGTQTLFLS
jgi:hypothetical protein